MAEMFAGGHLRYQQGAWRDDNGDPVDCVEVVRCRDCVYYKQNPYNSEDIDLMCQCWADWLPTGDDDFCSYGERVEDDGK